MIKRENFTVASSGTASGGIAGQGYRLVGLILPALDSTTVGFQWSPDNSAWSTIYTNSGATAAVTLGNADTGSKAQAVPDEVGKLSAVGWIRLVVASQTGGARTIASAWERIGT